MKTMTTELWQYDAEHALKLTLTVQYVFTREGQFWYSAPLGQNLLKCNDIKSLIRPSR